jgi:amino acid permease
VKWGAILGITLAVALMILYEWPKFTASQFKTKAAFTTLTATGWLLAILLVHYPNMPGTTDLLLKIFKPLTDMVEQNKPPG